MDVPENPLSSDSEANNAHNNTLGDASMELELELDEVEAVSDSGNVPLPSRDNNKDDNHDEDDMERLFGLDSGDSELDEEDGRPVQQQQQQQNQQRVEPQDGATETWTAPEGLLGVEQSSVHSEETKEHREQSMRKVQKRNRERIRHEPGQEHPKMEEKTKFESVRGFWDMDFPVDIEERPCYLCHYDTSSTSDVSNTIIIAITNQMLKRLADGCTVPMVAQEIVGLYESSVRKPIKRSHPIFGFPPCPEWTVQRAIYHIMYESTNPIINAAVELWRIKKTMHMLNKFSMGTTTIGDTIIQGPTWKVMTIQQKYSEWKLKISNFLNSFRQDLLDAKRMVGTNERGEIILENAEAPNEIVQRNTGNMHRLSNSQSYASSSARGGRGRTRKRDVDGFGGGTGAGAGAGAGARHATKRARGRSSVNTNTNGGGSSSAYKMYPNNLGYE